MATLPETKGEQVSLDAFEVTVGSFSGPFDLLLSLVAKRRLDVTEVALAEVTDEFLAHMRAFPDLSRATEFLVVAATLLDIKAARLLPETIADAEEDLAILGARDLLFARLLQYRAFKVVAGQLAEQLYLTSRRIPRRVPLEPHFAALLPTVVMQTSPAQLVQLAAAAISARPSEVTVTHLHEPAVPVAAQARVLVAELRRASPSTFGQLVVDADTPAVVIARFLAVLELFRVGAVQFAQPDPLGELTVTWVGPEKGDVNIADDYDQNLQNTRWTGGAAPGSAHQQENSGGANE